MGAELIFLSGLLDLANASVRMLQESFKQCGLSAADDEGFLSRPVSTMLM